MNVISVLLVWMVIPCFSIRISRNPEAEYADITPEMAALDESTEMLHAIFADFNVDFTEEFADQQKDKTYANYVEPKERAINLLQCGKKYSSTHPVGLVYLSKRLHLAYIQNAKGGSSTMRTVEHDADGRGKEPQQSNRDVLPTDRLTYFSFVRDPIKRMISGFFEETTTRHICLPGLYDVPAGHVAPDFCKFGRDPRFANPNNITDRELVLSRFSAMLDSMEQGKWSTTHVVSQYQTFMTEDLEWLGDLNQFERDWTSLKDHQVAKGLIHHNVWPATPLPKRTSSSDLTNTLNSSMIQGNLAQRICEYYKVDYCCLSLPIPKECVISCASDATAQDTIR